jgi:tetratricopeptide (TPR) repeat protein
MWLVVILVAALSGAPDASQAGVEDPGSSSAPASAETAAPEELQGLLDLLAQSMELGEGLRAQDEVARALRRFDRLQQALADWDALMAEELAAKGQTDVAQSRLEQRKQRLELINKAYLAFLSYYPKHPRALNYYGEFLYDRKGDITRAIQYWRWAEALDGEYSAPLNNLGIHYCHAGDYEWGLNYFDEAIEIDPDNPDYLYNLAQIYLINSPQVCKRNKWDKKRLYKEAMKLSAKAAKLAPDDLEIVQDYAVNFFAAENFGVEADWSDAAKAWQKARACARENDDIFYTWLNEGRVWIRENNTKRAAECLQTALTLRPDSDVAKRLLEKTTKGDASPAGKPKASAPSR